LACSRQEADVAIETRRVVETLIDDVRAAIRGAPDPEQPPLEPIKAAIERALADPRCLNQVYRADDEPAAKAGLLYEDPDYGFAVWASVQAPGTYHAPHDHGPTWAVYGVYAGKVDTGLYERTDDGSREGYAEVREIQRVMAQHGDVACMPKGIAHETLSADEKPALNLIIRGLKTYWQHVYDPAARTVKVVGK
jgi:predicted metal-dependent enzyme (double-stranded beta helix superfamily)